MPKFTPYGMVIAREEAESYWQPAPSHGCMNTILTPKNCPSNTFAVATQYIDVGCAIRPHAHEAAEEILFLYEGEGTLNLERREIPARPGTTCLVGRYTLHELLNKSKGTMKVLAVLFPPGTEIAWRGIGKPRRWGEEAPPAYGRDQIPNLKDLLQQARFAQPDRIDNATAAEKGAAICLAPDEGPSFWQPKPTGGSVTWKLWHGSMTSNMFAMGTQSIPPGGRLMPRSFSRSEGMMFVYRGQGTAIVNGSSKPIGPESLIYVGRDAEHSIENTGSTDLEFVWVVTPPGSEEATRLLGRPRQPGQAAPQPFEAAPGWQDSWSRVGLKAA